MERDISNMISTLTNQHRALQERFDEHQEALVDRRWATASMRFAEFQRDLLNHMAAEELDLFPACDAVASPSPGMDPRLYRSEHQHIRSMIQDLSVRVADLCDERRESRSIIDVLDAERALKHVLAHHCAREEQYLFAAAATLLNALAPIRAEVSHAI